MKKRKRQTSPSHSVSSPHPTLVYHKPFEVMTPDEALVWLRGVKERLERKMQRERAYLDRRAARGIRTPTDEAYEADLVLEQEMLTLLEHLEQVHVGEV